MFENKNCSDEKTAMQDLVTGISVSTFVPAERRY